jgi:transposase
MMTTTRRQFTREFKLEAVRLTKESGKPQAQVARELGIRPDMLRTWKRQAEGRAGFAAADVFPGNSHQPRPDEELQRLRRENERLRQERDFLKKAAAYFAKESR